MLRTRLIVGTVMAVAAVALLAADPGPTYPGLLALTLVLGVAAVVELRGLLPVGSRPPRGLAGAGVLGVLLTNWLGGPSWGPAGAVLAAVTLAALVREVLTYAGDGHATARAANALLATAYLGVLPSFLLRLRWLPDDRAGVALLLAVFVPKCGDIGAYVTGRLVGRTPMAPRLSPKKTWEGFAGGTLFAAGAAAGLGRLAPVFPHGLPEAVAFGVVVGWAGVLGDLAESVLKRDARAKDASAAVPGFGGVLDVIDSVIFAAPVVYLWLAR